MPTGLKFIMLTDPKQLGMDILLKKIYELYSDFALKNPFYSLDMPIRYLLKKFIMANEELDFKQRQHMLLKVYLFL